MRAERRYPRISDLATIADTTEYVGGGKTNASLRGRKLPDHFGASYETLETSKEIQRTLKIGVDPSSDFPDRTRLRKQKKQISKVLI